MKPTLTNRQASVLSMVAEGCDVQQIAAYLYLSCREVRRLLSDCLDRLGVPTVNEAVECALELRLILNGGVVA